MRIIRKGIVQAGGVGAVLLIMLRLPRLAAAAGGTFSPTGSMSTARQSHTATVLPNGQVLIAGGTMVLVSPSRVPSYTTRPPVSSPPPAA
jgi:hypothetical protein